MACQRDDLGGAFALRLAGDFSTRNLADLANDAPGRRAELEAAGLRGGRFNYWKEAVGRPPFESPAEAVCQVMEFGNEDEAVHFVRSLRAQPDALATSAFTWLPASHRKAGEVAPPEDLGLPEGTRAFRIEAASPEADVGLYAIVATQGRFVQSVYMGSNGNGGTSLRAASAVLARLARRSRVVAVAR